MCLSAQNASLVSNCKAEKCTALAIAKAECVFYLVPVAAAARGGEQEYLCILFHNDLRLSLTLNLAVVKFRKILRLSL